MVLAKGTAEAERTRRERDSSSVDGSTYGGGSSRGGAMSELLEQFASVMEAGRPAALATLVAAAGATPKKAGSTMWVSDEGAVLGSVTIGGCVDARVVERAQDVVTSGQPEL